MSLKHKIDYLSIQDYLEGELVSTIKHEYIDGHMYAMAGASTNHNRICSSLNREFGIHLRHTPCEPFVADMKVRGCDDFFYPDVLVACHHQSNDYGVTDSPLIIVEVLSKNTRKIDHTIKRKAYQSLKNLQEYVVIEQDIADVEICRRRNYWQSEHYFLGDEAYFESIDLRLPVAVIYEPVENADVPAYLQTLQEVS